MEDNNDYLRRAMGMPSSDEEGLDRALDGESKELRVGESQVRKGEKKIGRRGLLKVIGGGVVATTAGIFVLSRSGYDINRFLGDLEYHFGGVEEEEKFYPESRYGEEVIKLEEFFKNRSEHIGFLKFEGVPNYELTYYEYHPEYYFLNNPGYNACSLSLFYAIYENGNSGNNWKDSFWIQFKSASRNLTDTYEKVFERLKSADLNKPIIAYGYFNGNEIRGHFIDIDGEVYKLSNKRPSVTYAEEVK